MYPALAVVQEWKSATATSDHAVAEGALPQLEAVLYVGTAGGLETSIVPRAGIALRTVDAAAIRGKSPWRMLMNGLASLRGIFQAWRILRDFRPAVVLATGGYASVPVAIAAWLRHCPVLVYLPDIQPGLAVRFLSHLAGRVAVSFDAAQAYFPAGKTVVTGYPVRPALFGGEASRETAREALGLAGELKTLLVLGGSRGAHSINAAIHADLDKLLVLAQVVHSAGEEDVAWLQERRDSLPADLRERYHLYPYLHEEMVPALLAADLAVARAGAATMGEFAAAGLPSLLVPYPYSGQHQDANADYMVSCGAALKILDGSLAARPAGAQERPGAMLPTVERLLADESALRSMSDSARKLARPDAARAIAGQLASLATTAAPSARGAAAAGDRGGGV